MDPGNNEQTELLRNIWNEMKAVNGRVNQTNERLDTAIARINQTNERLGQTNEQLGELRAEVRSGFQRIDERFDALLLGEHGREHAELRSRVVRIEDHLGLPPPDRS